MVVIQRSMRDPSSRTWIRRWSNATFIDGLSNSRSAEDKEKIVDELFKRYEMGVASALRIMGWML